MAKAAAHNNQQQTTTTVEAPPLDQSIVNKILDQTVTYRPFMGGEDISLSPRTILRYFARPTKQGHMPTHEQAAKFVRLCQARGLNPWEGDAFIVGYDTQDGPEFNLITAHQAFLKRAEVHPEYDGMESGVTVKRPDGTLADQEGDLVDEGQVLVGGWARVHFKQRKVPTYRRSKLTTYSTGRSRWNKDPAGMIVKVAEADALRSSFPTKMGGMFIREEFDATESEAAPRAPVPMPRAIDEPPSQPVPTPEVTGNVPSGNGEPQQPPQSKPISKAQISALNKLRSECDLPDSEWESMVGADVAALTAEQADVVRGKLEAIKGRQSPE